MKVSNKLLKNTIVILLIAIFILFPGYNLFTGIYKWHIMQPQFYKGITFHIVYFIIFMICLFLNKQKKFEIILFGGITYLCLQGVILPCLLAYLYFEIICFIGNTLHRIIYHEDNESVTINFIMGLCFWGACGILLSLLGVGRINDLRLMTLGLLLASLFLNKKKYNCILLQLKDFVNNSNIKFLDTIIMLALIFLPLVFMAETNLGPDVDSIWYILKPEHMLVGNNSFYDYLGYSAFVHYYPKLVEFFFLPLSGLGDYSFILVGNVLILVLLMVSIYEGLLLFQNNIEKRYRMIFILIIVSIPAFSNISVTAKGDIFGCYLSFAGFMLFLNFIVKKQIKYIFLSMISLGLATGTKVTYLLWGGVIAFVIIGFLIFYFLKREKKKLHNREMILPNGLIVLFAFIFIGGIHYRTFLLTGYPIYPLATIFFEKLGFTGKEMVSKYGAGTLVSSVDLSIEFVCERIYSFFLNPSSLSHTVFCWPTAIIILAWIKYIQLIISKKIIWNKVNLYFSFTLILQSAAAINFLITLQQPDGNYFIFPYLITLFTVYCMIMQYKNINCKTHKTIFALLTICILLINIPLSYVSSWSWNIGTKYYDFNVIKTNFETMDVNEEYFTEKGYHKISQYIADEFGNKRGLISGDEGKLDGAIETCWSAFSPRWCSSDILGGYDQFKAYVLHANIEGFMVLNDDVSDYKSYVNLLIQEYSIEKIIYDEGAIFYQMDFSK